MIRPELRDLFRRWSEPIAAIGAGLFFLWLGRLGGWFFGMIGIAGGTVALIWLLGALRRLRFARGIAAPGVVEVDEGAIRYYGAQILGGEIAIRDLTEIRLMRLNGAPHWRLRASDGQALLVPLEAAGAPVLADAFAALPGLDMGAIAAALARLDHDGPAVLSLWRRPV